MLSTQRILETIFPQDIAGLIHDKAARSEHKFKLNSCFEQMRIKCVMREYDRLYQSFDIYDIIRERNEYNGLYESFDMYYDIPNLFNDEEDMHDAISVLGSCNCCEVHQKNRPCSIDSPEDTYIIARKRTKNIPKPCKCKCRHIARAFVHYTMRNSELLAKIDRLTLHQEYRHQKKRVADFTGVKDSEEYIGLMRETSYALSALMNHMCHEWPDVSVPQDDNQELLRDMFNISDYTQYIDLDF